MKRLMMIFALIISLVINLFFAIYVVRSQNTIIKQDTMYSKLNSSLVDNFIDQYDEGKKCVVYIGRSSCSDCNHFDTISSNVIDKYNLNKQLSYVNVEDIHKDKERWENFKKKFSIKGTPTLAVYNDKRLITKLDFEETGGFTPKELDNWVTVNLLSK